MQIIKSEAIEAVQYLRFWYGGVSTRGKHAKSHRMFFGRRVLLRQLIHPTGNLVNHQNQGWDGEEQGTDLGSEVDVLLDDEVSMKQLLSVEAREDGADDGELGGDACDTREMGSGWWGACDARRPVAREAGGERRYAKIEEAMIVRLAARSGVVSYQAGD